MDLKVSRKFFLYENEEWMGVFVQNNTEISGYDSLTVLRQAWQFYENYLKWEDGRAEQLN